jgi:hypothetical protein
MPSHCTGGFGRRQRDSREEYCGTAEPQENLASGPGTIGEMRILARIGSGTHFWSRFWQNAIYNRELKWKAAACPEIIARSGRLAPQRG